MDVHYNTNRKTKKQRENLEVCHGVYGKYPAMMHMAAIKRMIPISM